MLRYFVSVDADTEEVRELLKNKREISALPFETDVKGKYYESVTQNGEKAYIVIENDKYLYLYQ